MKTYTFCFLADSKYDEPEIIENIVLRTNAPIETLDCVLLTMWKKYMGFSLDSIYFNTEDGQFHGTSIDYDIYINYELARYTEYIEE